MMTGEFLLFGGLFSLISQVLVFVLVLLVAVAVATGRGEPDPGRTRLRATYLCTVVFLSLFATLFSAGAAVGSLVQAIGEGGGDAGPEFELSPRFGDDGFEIAEQFGEFDGDRGSEGAVSGMVQGVVFALVAGGVLLYHRNKLQELQREPGFGDAPAAAVLHTYLYASSIVGLIAFVVAGAIALHALAEVVAPGSLSTDDPDTVREEAVRRVFTAAFVALASLAVVVFHQREREAMDAPEAPEAAPPGDPMEGDYPIA
ncbi:MAG: hypothetical protein KY443_07840 [Actinobacteria bacterium]|nr:hypothetical protein [Actinomycetota bacterium]